MLIGLSTGDTDLHCLVQLVSAGFLYYKVIVFPFGKYLGGNIWKDGNSGSHKFMPTDHSQNPSVDPWGVCLKVIAYFSLSSYILLIQIQLKEELSFLSFIYITMGPIDTHFIPWVKI